MTAATGLSHDVPANVLHRMWFAIGLRGAAAIAFALLAYLWAGHSLASLLGLFALYAAFDGFCSFFAAARGGGAAARVGMALIGATSLVAAGAALLPDLSWDAFAMIVGGWCLVRGGIEFGCALTLRRYMERDWSLALIGMVSIFFGVGVLLWPSIDPWTFVRLFCTVSLICGALFVLLGRRFRRGLRP